MPEASSFDELIRRVRAWDQEAAAELVRRYEPAIRRAVRFRLAGSPLTGLLDSMDICQSVLGSFFLRAASGQYDLETPEKVLALLAAMARNKLATQVRRQGAEKRGHLRRASARDEAPDEVADPGAGPGRVVAARDLLQEVRHRLKPDELRLLDLRNEGHDWATIAAQLGGTEGALGKKLSRALDRVAAQLGLSDEP
jgi:RNA polymerase sigma-70 factor (ECF subfamily)